MRGKTGFLLSLIAFSLVLAANAQAAAPKLPDYNAILAQPDRTDADKQNDQRRHAAEMLAFVGCRPGMKDLDMAADAGYSTELMARCVGPKGKVYGQNDPGLPQKTMDAFKARLGKPATKNIVSDVQPFETPIPKGVKNLDLITFFYGYHDVANTTTDRAKMDKAMFNALKHGGTLVIADYAAKPGAPATTSSEFHRLDEAIEKRELEAAGFKLADEGNFLRAPSDTHDFKIFGAKQPIDIFVLKFKKP
ncbi:MAG TPA: class I SAM-dependent methyltransferase [Stellaceae bacterium]|nr:class I SAM-dependent methyltransferase [Stellaceae bacterium]